MCMNVFLEESCDEIWNARSGNLMGFDLEKAAIWSSRCYILGFSLTNNLQGVIWLSGSQHCLPVRIMWGWVEKNIGVQWGRQKMVGWHHRLDGHEFE